MELGMRIPKLGRLLQLCKAKEGAEVLCLARKVIQPEAHPASCRALATLTAESSGGHTTSLEVERQQHGNSGVDEAEVGKFSAMAAKWWDPQGPMAPLHSMNPIRVRFCRQAICDAKRRSEFDTQPFRGLEIADIGAGGGLLSESLARLGASVTGIEPSADAIGVARLHAAADSSIAQRLRYAHGTAEQLAARGETFDAVIASEVIEHVPDPEQFCRSLAALTRPDGSVVLSTINRTPRAYALAILAAERVLGILPVGTHDWNKFITPDELVLLMQGGSMKLDKIQGMTLNPLSQQWGLSDDLGVNYIAAFVAA